jgi:SAM-dependent methyltransferase
MDEARKTNRLRGEEFGGRFFGGRVIDVGCGPDLVVPNAVPFDLEHGDAERILDYFEAGSFDCVHSSHCLEHMRDVKTALAQWWGLVRPGGYLVIVVPDEDLYEQGMWPSLFNPDHKATFRLGKQQSWSPVSYDIDMLVRALPGAEIVEATLQDSGYDRRLMRRRMGWLGRLQHQFGARRQDFMGGLMRRGVPVYRLNRMLDRIERWLGKPIDQTLGPAMAQIQIIARRSPVSAAT